MIGIIFRFSSLEGKVYEYDETYTSLRISGYTEAEAVKSLSSAGVIDVADLINRYQHPSLEKSPLDTIKGLATEEAQLTPLYFVTARFWTEWFGSSVGVIRSLSAFVSLLAFPLMGWLCVELFETPLAGWLGAALLAVAPFHVLYAKQARPIGFWTVTILLASAMLLRAMRVKTRTAWLLYAVSLAIAFYTYLFTALVAIAHAVYIFVRFRFSKPAIAFAVALGFGVLAFAPWIVVILLNWGQVDYTTSEATLSSRASLTDLYRTWVHHLTLAFIDPAAFQEPGALAPPLFYRAMPTLFYWAVRILVVYAFYRLCRDTPVRVWLFVVTLTVIPALTLSLPDLVLGGSRAMTPRYIAPVYLGFELAVTYLLSSQLLNVSPVRDWQQKLWRIATITILSVGIASCVVISEAEAWWTQTVGHHNPEFARIINRADRPLVVSNAVLGDLLSLSHALDPKVHLLVKPQCFACKLDRALNDTPYLPSIPPGFSDVFLYYPRPTETYLARLNQQKKYSLEIISQGFDNWFWKIESAPLPTSGA